jgi:hypothetical protein
MPAITMKWKAPPPPPRAAAPAAKKASPATPKPVAMKKIRLDLDRAARLHPKRFESMWDEYVERFVDMLWLVLTTPSPDLTVDGDKCA